MEYLFVFFSNIGVHQGGTMSGLMFRKYMSDLSEYLSKQFEVVVSDDIVMHILWRDNLILFSDTVDGLQRQLYGLGTFCSRNEIIINETKTKFMSFGATGQFKVYYSEKNFSFIGDKARKAILACRRN